MTARFNRAAAAAACTLVAAGSAWTAAAAEAPSAAELERYAPNLVRLSRISVDPAQLEQYKAILAEEARASMAAEPGVRILYAVSEKKDPTKFTILEIYASQEAYQSHLKTPHFLKYKNGTLYMVKSLELIDCDPLVPEALMKP